MKTYIKDNTLHVELTQEETNALLCTLATGAGSLNRTAQGEALRHELSQEIRRHVARHGWETVLRFHVTPDAPEARLDALEAQREAWAQKASRTTPFPLAVCRIVATHATSEAEADAIIELALTSGRGPESVIDAVQQYHAKEAPRKGWTPNKQKP